MDYTETFEFITLTSGITNMDDQFMLFYDETNNPRSFKLTDSGFNVNEREHFILGGIGFQNINVADNAPIEDLFQKFRMQSNTTEIKFKHIKQNSKSFIELISKPKVNLLLDWLLANSVVIHYSYIDNFYYTIVDIIDSTDEAMFGGPVFNRELKNSLYSLIKKHQEWFIDLLVEVDYPNIKNHRYFIEKIVDWIWSLNITDDFNLEYIRQSLKSYRNKSLVFLENNEDRIAIDNYSGFYANCIVTFPKAYHLFDREPVVEQEILKNHIVIHGQKLSNYSFVNSKTNRLIQVSDLVVGILRYWMMFLEEKSILEIKVALDSTTDEQYEYIKKFQKLLLISLEVSTGFKHGIGSNNFEEKISFFLDYKL